MSAVTGSLPETDVFGATYYSGTVDNVRRVVDMLTIGEGTKSSFTPAICERYQKEVDGIINGRIRSYYAVPLVKNADGHYPDPIPFIASRLVASNIVLVEFTEVDPNDSEAAEAFKNSALDELDRLTTGLIGGANRLPGQRLRTRNRFVSPGIAPQAEVKDLAT